MKAKINMNLHEIIKNHYNKKAKSQELKRMLQPYFIKIIVIVAKQENLTDPPKDFCKHEIVMTGRIALEQTHSIFERLKNICYQIRGFLP